MKKVLFLLLTLLLVSCSMTRDIPADDQLFAGLTTIDYTDAAGQPKDHLATIKEEMEAALATQPNGSLFGSSYYSVPWSFRLWVYNRFSKKDGPLARWITKSFGKPPVLLSQVNPSLRASVARSVLRNNGYFRGDVAYQTLTQKNPRKAKIAYRVHLDSLFTVDSFAYVGFPDTIRQLLSTSTPPPLAASTPLTLAALDAERSRVNTVLQNNGYYLYSPTCATFFADTFATAGKVALQLRLSDGLPPETFHKWHIGQVSVNFRKTPRETLADTIRRRSLTISFNGHRPPVRPGVVLRSLQLRPGQLYSYEKHQTSASRINATGLFSTVNFLYTPREQDSLDLALTCTFDKPYDFYFEANAIGRTIGRYGPEAKVGFTRRNAFRGAEKLDVNLHGSYEWQRSGNTQNSSYQYGADITLSFPRTLSPFTSWRGPRRPPSAAARQTPRNSTTLLKASTDIVRRPGYYKMHIVAGEWTYSWQTSQQSHHQFTPLMVKYQFMNSHTQKFDSIMLVNPYLLSTMSDYFIPKIRYTYTYTSPQTLLNPIRWETTVEASGNITSLGYCLLGHSFNEKDKKLFKNPYAQFVRFETDFTKTWTIDVHQTLVAHVDAGFIRPYGNSSDAPFSEMFYAGGANSIRAFPVRGIGPGDFQGISGARQFNYLLQNGEIKFVANLEYRPRLFGNLNGALFLDAGNVWNWHSGLLSNKPSADQIALGAGVGLRYDLGFLVVRLDWGLALHAPYDTGRSGYFNINRFSEAHTLHFAIGYPF